mmetsp:Transcript_21736/g.33231  ORF Transcript_21736/g.33231 Transcript_21736/m.33231 type:complete len:84 (+) Transcript_21736:119-370(+)
MPLYPAIEVHILQSETFHRSISALKQPSDNVVAPIYEHACVACHDTGGGHVWIGLLREQENNDAQRDDSSRIKKFLENMFFGL